jgi:Zn-dependent protease
MGQAVSLFGMVLPVLVAVVPAILAITLHEAAHGYAALMLGDDTARRAGRLSLNPLRHIDRMGTIVVPAVLLVVQYLTIHHVAFMFGWAKPVPVDARRFPNPRRGMAWVAAAGPAMNFALAWLGALLMPAAQGTDASGFAALDDAVSGHPLVGLFLFYFILTNLVLGLFNLLPIPPLDGGRIAVGVLPLALARRWARLERAGILIVVLLVFILPRVLDVDPVGGALGTVLPWAFRTVFWLSGHQAGDVGDSL